MAGVPDFARRDKAFRLYAQYKNMSKVSKELKIPTQTLLVWKKQEKWDEKLAQLREKLKGQMEILQKAEDNFVIERDLQKIKLIEILEEEVAKAIEEKKVVIEKWQDVIKTLEFTTKERRLLLGEPTDRTNGAIDVSFMKEEDLDKEIADLRRLIEKK